MTPDLVYGCLALALPAALPASVAARTKTADAQRAGGRARGRSGLRGLRRSTTAAPARGPSSRARALGDGVPARRGAARSRSPSRRRRCSITRRELRSDSGGAGTFRGGLGQRDRRGAPTAAASWCSCRSSGSPTRRPGVTAGRAARRAAASARPGCRGRGRSRCGPAGGSSVDARRRTASARAATRSRAGAPAAAAAAASSARRPRDLGEMGRRAVIVGQRRHVGGWRPTRSRISQRRRGVRPVSMAQNERRAVGVERGGARREARCSGQLTALYPDPAWGALRRAIAASTASPRRRCSRRQVEGLGCPGPGLRRAAARGADQRAARGVGCSARRAADVRPAAISRSTRAAPPRRRSAARRRARSDTAAGLRRNAASTASATSVSSRARGRGRARLPDRALLVIDESGAVRRRDRCAHLRAGRRWRHGGAADLLQGQVSPARGSAGVPSRRRSPRRSSCSTRDVAAVSQAMASAALEDRAYGGETVGDARRRRCDARRGGKSGVVRWWAPTAC